MKCPTNEQVLNAAKTGKEAEEALKQLFPEVFADQRQIKKGEIYEWGTLSDGGAGVVIEAMDNLIFTNFHTGDIILYLWLGATIADLNYKLARLPYSCYEGVLRGPKHFKSWCLK